MPNKLYFPLKGTLTPQLTILTGRFRLLPTRGGGDGESIIFDEIDALGMSVPTEYDSVPYSTKDNYQIQLDQNYNGLIGVSTTLGFRNDETPEDDTTVNLLVTDRRQIGDPTIKKPIITLTPYAQQNVFSSGFRVPNFNDTRYLQFYIVMLLRNSGLKY